MNRDYRLTPEARTHLDEIISYIAEDNVDAADRVLNALEHAFDELAAMPGIGHKREDLTRRPVKFWAVFSYLIVYEPASVPLTIIAILHGARDARSLLGDFRG